MHDHAILLFSATRDSHAMALIHCSAVLHRLARADEVASVARRFLKRLSPQQSVSSLQPVGDYAPVDPRVHACARSAILTSIPLPPFPLLPRNLASFRLNHVRYNIESIAGDWAPDRPGIDCLTALNSSHDLLDFSTLRM